MIIVMDEELLCKNIRFLRKRKKLSREKFANLINMSYSHLYCIEKKISCYIDSKSLMTLIKLFGIHADEFMSTDLEEKYKNKRLRYHV